MTYRYREKYLEKLLKDNYLVPPDAASMCVVHTIARKHAVAQSFVVQDNSRETFAQKDVGPKQVVKFLLHAAVGDTDAETVKNIANGRKLLPILTNAARKTPY